MTLFVQPVLWALLLLAVPAMAAVAGEPDLSGLWRGSLYGSDVQARVEQEGHHVKAEVVVVAMTGETNVYHLVGAVFNGHVYMVHGSGHVFEGDATSGAISGVLTTKGGSRLDVQATKVPLQGGRKTPSDGTAAAASRRPG
ncbi:hypothetical protein [Solidesulfovibrio alcoholivorans]|uniref:hypothetical protein n=1 Tax=Solidesulfovibrio alcoholivorans TaxID=81406 RepID=UPI000495A719|nr:hypothetical protein [Solidesulfovibrio alcoholivorans]